MIPIQLDKPRHILLDMRAIYKVELALAALYGEKRVSLPKLFKQGDLSMTELLHLLWGGLLHEEPTLTLDRVAELLATVPTRQLDVLLGEALREQTGMEEQPAADPTMAMPSGTGSGSGAMAGLPSGSPMPSSGA
jgi:hypothetical protein